MNEAIRGHPIAEPRELNHVPRSIMTVQQVAQALHVSTREVVRMAEQRILPGLRVKDRWEFRAGEIWNWIEKNIESLPKRRERDPHPAVPSDLLLTHVLTPRAVRLNTAPKTKSALLRALADLAAECDPTIDAVHLASELAQREQVSSTALERGVAVPHPRKPIYLEQPVLAAMRTSNGLAFGERAGGLTDLFFLICAPDHVSHLLFLGRLCRLFIDDSLIKDLRAAEDADDFIALLTSAEHRLCRTADIQR
ncbi:MAG: PTS fructose transporter subunit IIA [Phycisphaerae bacterium]|nr:MAG: PTS fructose transporter subunit IIA [Phycisphaerae bacterium]